MLQTYEAVDFSKNGPTPIASVSEYPSASSANDPNLYPGTRPENSYLTDGQNIYSLQAETKDDRLSIYIDSDGVHTEIDNYLEEHGVALMDKRLPVLAFGANMAPGSLAVKFKKDTTETENKQIIDNRPDLSIVPTVYGALAGHDVVWSGGPGVNGNCTAVLYSGPETTNTTVQVGINFLTPEQLLIMHSTELNYNLSTITIRVGDTDVQAYYYVGTDDVLVEDDAPIAIQSIPATGRIIDAKSASDVMNIILADDTVRNEVAATVTKQFPDQASELPSLDTVEDAKAYVQFLRTYAKSVTGSRLKIKNAYKAGLRSHGYSKQIDNNDTDLLSWANPSTLPTYGEQIRGTTPAQVYRLPSQELPKDAWKNSDKRQKVLRSMVAHLVRVSGNELELLPQEKPKV